MTVLVVGNGESRKNLDLNKFKLDYTTVGCNALHRDVEVDHLVCCDRRMAEEAVISDNTKNTSIYVRNDWYNYFRKIKKDKRINRVPDLPYKGNLKQDNPVHWGSGPYAMLLAASLSDSIMILGFDLYSKNGKVNNLYKDTKNYSSKKNNSVDYSFWVHQIGKVFQHNQNKSFLIFNEENWELPRQWKFPNVSFKILESKNLTLA